MATTASYVVFLTPPLSTPEQIQEIGNLPRVPELRLVDEEGLEDEEREVEGEQNAPTTSCCVVDRATKDAIVEWAHSTGAAIKPIIPIIPTEPADTSNALRTYPVPYFLFGALASPALLQDILDLGQPPTLQRATIRGLEERMWGEKNAIVASQTSTTVEGCVYTARSEEEVAKLADHEGFAFEVAPCKMTYTDGKLVEGNVFRYRGHNLGLEDLRDQT